MSPDGLHMNDWSYACLAKGLALAIAEAATRHKATAAGPQPGRLAPPTDLFICAKDLFVEAMSPTIQGRSAADPKKAHPRISATSGMPNAMVAHISSFGHGTSAWDLISL